MGGFGREDVAPLDAEAKELDRLIKVYDGFRCSWTLATDEARVALIKERWRRTPGPEASSTRPTS